jgi:hydroxyacylglutathione hydrolase
MAVEIMRILAPGFGGGVNAYLLAQDGAHVLVDTLIPSGRKALVAALDAKGVRPGDLRLVVITHGDADHIGSAAFLQRDYRAPVAMHRAEVPVAERGGFFANRSSRPNLLVTWLIAAIGALFRVDRFTPEVLLTEGYDLREHGVDATVLELPGHSLGSIGVLTADGDLICGDLMENRGKPRPGSIVDDPATRDSSISRVRGLGVRMVYPGHGDPFDMRQFEAGLEGE